MRIRRSGSLSETATEGWPVAEQTDTHVSPPVASPVAPVLVERPDDRIGLGLLVGIALVAAVAAVVAAVLLIERRHATRARRPGSPFIGPTVDL